MHHTQLQKDTQKLCSIVSQIDTPQDAFAFLRDLLTHRELEEFSQRLEIATMLTKKISYKKIEQDTGASSTTIARVSKFLNGDIGGYRKWILED